MSKIILITGTSAGFGKLTAITLAKAGHRVIAGMRNTSTSNANAAAELSKWTNIEVTELDVNSETSVNDAVQRALKNYGRIDILINNAGIVGFGIAEGTSVDQMKKIFETNLWGMVRGYHAVLPAMRKQRSGLVINISSGLGLFSGPYTVPYNMSKFAIQGLTEGIRAEIKRFGIETVTVLPGPFPTEIGSKPGHGPDREDIVEAYGPEEVQALQQFGGNMFGKIEEYKADPQEVADAVKKIVNMSDGTRPHVTVVNRIGEGVEQKFADSKTTYYQEMMKNLGWESFV